MTSGTINTYGIGLLNHKGTKKMKYILPIFLTLCTFPMLGFAEPTISPFTKVTIYQNDISNTVTDTGIYNLCMNLQKFSLNNLGKAHLVKIQDDAVTSDHAPEYASHRRDGYAKSEIDIKNFCRQIRTCCRFKFCAK